MALSRYIKVLQIYLGCISIFAWTHPGIQSSPTNSCSNLESFNLTTHISNQIDSRIVGKNNATQWKLFSSSITNPNGVWTRNVDIWTNEDTDIDWTGISPYNTINGYHSPSTLISPRHIIFASHYGPTVGSTITFVDNNNASYQRTVVNRTTVSGDLSIGVLDSDVPDSITYYPIVPYSSLVQKLNKYNPQFYDIPFVTFDQEKKAIIRAITTLTSTIIGHTSYTSGPRSIWSEPIISGDSGNPSFLLIDNKPVIISAHYTATGGPNYSGFIAEINSAISILGNSSGYQVTEYDISCFDEQLITNNVPIFTSANFINTFAHMDSTTGIHTFSISDIDNDQVHTYSLTNLTSISNPSLSLNPADYFSLNNSTGELRQIADLDNQTLGNKLLLTVEATDNGTNPAKKSQTITVNIQYPVLEYAEILNSTLKLVYSHELDQNIIPSFSDFIVTINDAPTSVIGINISGKNVILNLGTIANNGDIVKFSYNHSANKITDIYGAVADTIVVPIFVPSSLAGQATSFSISGTTTGGVGAILSDDKMLFLGTSFNGLSITQRLVRINSDGTLDTSFNSGGIGLNGSGSLSHVALQSDGKIIIVGTFTSYNGVGRKNIARLNADGTLDTSFDPGLGSNNSISRAWVQGDKILIAVSTSPNTYNGTNVPRLFRINSDGTLDTSFNSGGSGPSVMPASLLVLRSGKILISGNITSYNGSTTGKNIFRLNADGTLDTSFDSGTGFEGAIAPMILNENSDGKIIIYGGTNIYNGNSVGDPLRINSDGTLDTSFNTGLYRFSGGFPMSAIMTEDNSIIVVGTFTSYNGVSVNRIVRLLPNASLDTTFNPGTGPNNGSGTRLYLKSDNKVILSGSSITSYNGLPRQRIVEIEAYSEFDNLGPAIVSIGSENSDGIYGIGSIVSIQIVFDDLVFVDTTSGTPTVLIETGTTDRAAHYVSGSGTNTLTFNYTVQPGDTSNDLDIADIYGFSLNEGNISDTSGNIAQLTLPNPTSNNSLSYQKNIIVDGEEPSLVYAQINSDTLTLFFNKILDNSSLPNVGDFTVGANGSTAVIDNITIDGYFITLEISDSIEYGDIIELSYTPGINVLTDASGNEVEEFLEQSVVNNTPDLEGPIIDEIIPISILGNDTTPNYTFSSNEQGTISYSGSCIGSTEEVLIGNNTITFLELEAGTYDDCAITVSDYAGNTSNTLNIAEFTIDVSAPILNSYTPNGNTILNLNEVITLSMSFSEDIVKGTGNISIFNTSDDTVFAAIDVNNSSGSEGYVSISENIVTVTLPLNTFFNEIGGYYAQIDGTAFSDTAGNNFAGVDDKTSFVFQGIMDSDTVPPSAPTSFTATVSGIPASTVNLSWVNPVADFASVTIRRSTTNYPTSITEGTAVATNITSTSYADVGLANGTYYYSIFAKDIVGNVSTSAQATAIVNVVTDTSAPIISAGYPSTDTRLSAGTTSVNLSITTNENATCKYSTTAGISYASMTDTFTLTGTTTHTQVLTSLTNGTNYTYSVRCSDTANNVTTSDYTISFSVRNAFSGGGGSIVTATSTNTTDTNSNTSQTNTQNSTTINNNTSVVSRPGLQDITNKKFIFSLEDPNIGQKLGMTSAEYNSMCETKQGKPYYRKCELGISFTTFIQFRDSVVCEGFFINQKNEKDYRKDDTAQRKEVINVAVKMRKIQGESVSFITPEKYQNIYTDIDNTMKILLGQADWIRPVAETALYYNIISRDRTIFEPDRNITRAEAYAVMTKAICVTTDIKPDETWQQAIYRLAQKNNLTVRNWNTFESERFITRQELFTIASKVADLAERTGGCNPKPEKCFVR